VSSEVVTTWLRLRELRAAEAVAGADIGRVEVPDGAVCRWFYESVGRDYRWTDRLGWSDAQWEWWASGVELWVATVRGERAGYFELRVEDGAGVQVAHFGLLEAFHGRGLGGWLLTVALRRAQEIGDPVWLHTCTLDGPAALPNYLARGMVPYRTETTGVR
jgi:GNAT superfamily N-acetyltransferase